MVSARTHTQVNFRNRKAVKSFPASAISGQTALTIAEAHLVHCLSIVYAHYREDRKVKYSPRHKGVGLIHVCTRQNFCPN